MVVQCECQGYDRIAGDGVTGVEVIVEIRERKKGGGVLGDGEEGRES